MGKVLISEPYLEDIGDAIREKNGTGTVYKPSQMGDAIRAISTDATLIEKSITLNGTYTASDDDADGYSSVTVAVPGGSTLVPKTITANGTYDPADDNADGYSSVTVDINTTFPELQGGLIIPVQNLEIKLADSGSPYITPLSNGGTIVVDVTQSFEIGITFKADSLTSTSRVLSGQNGDYFAKPWLQLSLSSDTANLFYAVFPTGSSSIVELNISASELPFIADTYFTAIISFDGANTVSLSVSDGTNTVTKQGTVSSLYSTNNIWNIGSINVNNDYRFANGVTFDFAHCYLKQSGTLVWGNE